MQPAKSLKLGILALLMVALTIFSGCGGTAPPINHSPIIIILTADSSSININQSITITSIATDQDGDTLTYIWTKTGGTISGSGSSIIWTAPATTGTYTITCTVSDGDLSDSQSFTVTVLEPEEETIIPDTTKIIDEETEEQVVDVTPDQSVITFTQSTPQTDSIEVGDIIVMGVTEQTPYGLLRKVIGINKGTTKYSPVYFYLGFATLEEAVQKGKWEYNHTLRPEDIEKGFVFPEGIRPVTGKASTTLDFKYEINDILYDQDNNPATTEDNIMATGYLAFDYQIIFDGEIDGHTLKYFIFENIIETDAELNISVGLSVSIADLANVADVTIGEPIPFTPVTVYIPTPIPLIVIPLVFFPSIEIKVGIEGEAHIVLDVGITQTTKYTAGIEFTDGDWQNITDPLPNIVNTIKLADPEGTIHVTAHAGPQLNCKLYKVAGPYCNIFGYLYFDADTTLDPWWDLDAGLAVSAGVKMDVLSIHWDSGELPLFDLLPRFDVTDAGGPFLGGEDIVTNVTAITVISNTQRNNFVDVINKDLENKERFRQGKGENTHYHIYVHWSTYSEANGYKVYRKVNEGDFVEVFDGYPPSSSNWPGWKGHGWYDFDVQEGNTYSYYVIAYGTGWQTESSEIATRYAWLPPCSLSSPSNGAIITISEPTFSWNPVGLETSDFPYGDIYYGITHLWMFDISTDEEVWWSSFYDMTTSTATYNYDGNATPLVHGHSYRWCTLGHGYDKNNNMIASSDSEWREFIYIEN